MNTDAIDRAILIPAVSLFIWIYSSKFALRWLSLFEMIYFMPRANVDPPAGRPTHIFWSFELTRAILTFKLALAALAVRMHGFDSKEVILTIVLVDVLRLPRNVFEGCQIYRGCTLFFFVYFYEGRTKVCFMHAKKSECFSAKLFLLFCCFFFVPISPGLGLF